MKAAWKNLRQQQRIPVLKQKHSFAPTRHSQARLHTFSANKFEFVKIGIVFICTFSEFPQSSSCCSQFQVGKARSFQ
jgi:hypothetical protein